MGFCRQLRYLLWKNFLVRRRQKLWCAVEVITPLFLFLIILLAKQDSVDILKPHCHYDAKAMPSAGLRPFLQSYICTIRNTCNQIPKPVRESNETNIFEEFRSAFEGFFGSSTEPQIVESLLRTVAEIVKLTASMKPAQSAESGIIVRDLFHEESRLYFVDLLVESGISNSTADMFMESELKSEFFVAEIAIFYLSAADAVSMFPMPKKPNFFEKTKQTIFCNKTMCERTIRARNASELNQIQQDFCANWNTVVFGDQLPLGTVIGMINLENVLSVTVPSALANITGFNVSTEQVLHMASLLYQFVDQLRNPELSRIVARFRNVTEALKTVGNASLPTLLCGSSFGDWKDVFQTLNGQEKRETERMKHRRKNQENESQGSESEDSTNPFPPINETERLLCGGVPINAKKVRGFLSNLGQIRAVILDFYYNSDSYRSALRNSDVGQSLKVLDVLLDRLGGNGILSAWLTEQERTTLKRGIARFNQLLANSSNADFFPKEQLTLLVKFFECFRLNRFVFVESEYGMEVLGSCLVDHFSYLSGFVFEVPPGATELNPLTVYKIRMASFLVDSTTRITNRIWKSTPRSSRAFIDLKYVYFGFSFLQDAVDRAIIKLQTNAPIETGIYAHQFPTPCYSLDEFGNVMIVQMPLYMILSWVFTAAILLKNIVSEKENRLKEVMKVMGLSNLVHWMAWFLQSFSVAMVSIALLTVMLKVGGVIEKMDPILLFVFLTMFLVATITQCFFFSTLFNRDNVAAACGAVAYFVFYIPYPFLQRRTTTMGYSAKTASCLVSQIAFGWGCVTLSDWEAEGSGAQWSNIAKSPAVDEDFNFLTVLLMLAVDSLIHLLLTWYIEAVCPGQYGIARPLYFPLLKSYWCGFSKKSVDVDVGNSEGGPGPDYLEPEPTELPLGVSMRNMKKIYSNGKVAVDGLSINFYEGQITSFLGHNGAGKTTALSILTGLYPPTEGTAVIYGRDIRTEFVEIRKSMGMCPQHNVLFDKLTVNEQLTFYAGLKGMKHKDIKNDVNKLLSDVGLMDKKNALAKTLSGGMRRKLSVAVAFVGGSKTVILDEPTAGVDPFARRGIWDLLSEYRKEKTIILSTHHMDEADILGDRIAIISEGKLQCCGSSIFLKKRFGSGYHLTVVKDTNPIGHNQQPTEDKKDPEVSASELHPANGVRKNEENPVGTSSSGGFTADSTKIVAFVQNKIPLAKLTEDVGSEMVFNLPCSDPSVLEEFFEDLDENLKSLGVIAYGVSDTTLEEIFLLMAGKESKEDFKKRAVCDCCTRLQRKLKMRSVSSPTTPESSDDANLIDSQEEIDKCDEDGSHPEISLGKRGKVWLARRRLWALLVKRFHSFRRNIRGACAEILFPVFLVFITILLLKILPKSPENQPPLLLTPWLYGTKDRPNVVFFSNEKMNSGGREWGDKIVDSLIRPPSLGIRCMTDSPLEDEFQCKPQKHSWEGSAYTGNFSVPETCFCRIGSGYVCPMNEYQPIPPRITLDTTDILVNMTGRNVSQWLMMTEKKYRKQSFGGFSVGGVNKNAFKHKTVGTRVADFLSFLGALSANLSINWNQGLVETYSNPGGELSLGDRIRAFLSRWEVKNTAEVWFNNNGWAALPAYMNTLSNAVLRALLPDGKNRKEYGIATYNHPMNYSEGQRFGKLEGKIATATMTGLIVAVMVILAFSVVPASFVLFTIDERVTHSKHLQFVSGVSPLLYWTSNLIWDMMNMMIPVVLCMIIFYIFEVKSFVGDLKMAAATFCLFTAYGFAIVPLMYPFTFVFRVPSSAFIVLAIGNFFVGVTATLTTTVLQIIGSLVESKKHLLEVNKVLLKVFLLFPQFSLGRGLLDLRVEYFKYTVQKELMGSAETPDPFAWLITGRNLVSLICQGIAAFAIVMLIEHRYLLNRCWRKKGSPECEVDDEDSDVAEERRRVLSGQADDSAVCINGLSKSYGCCKGSQPPAVDNLCIGIKAGECFGLLGVNGAGKTTAFKMLTGKIAVSQGDAFFKGLSVKRDIHKVHQMIGYSPQFDALHRFLTGKEHLTLYCRLRGIEEKDIKKVVDWTISRMHLEAHASQMTRNYSGGNRRKLSTAIALIGNPPVVLLDEPTTGMDPKAKRFLWNRITDVVREKRCVILTSHSMEECETLCNRIAIMVKGRMKCLGTVQHLKNKFGEGYTLSMVLSETETSSVEAAIEFVESEFPGAVLKERHRGMLQFRLPAKRVKLPRVFALVQQAKQRLKLEDYALCQTTLDQVFISFAEQQEEGTLDTTGTGGGDTPRDGKTGDTPNTTS